MQLSDPVLDRAVNRFGVFDRFDRLDAELRNASGGAVTITHITYSVYRDERDPAIREGR